MFSLLSASIYGVSWVSPSLDSLAIRDSAKISSGSVNANCPSLDTSGL